MTIEIIPPLNDNEKSASAIKKLKTLLDSYNITIFYIVNQLINSPILLQSSAVTEQYFPQRAMQQIKMLLFWQ